MMAAGYDDEPVYTIGSVLPRNTPLFARKRNCTRVPRTRT